MIRSSSLVVCPLISFLLIDVGLSAEKIAPRPAWTTSKINGTPTPPEPYRIVSAFPKLKFEKPSSLGQLPNGRMLVTEIGGKIFTFPKTKTVTTPDLAGDLTELFPKEFGPPAPRVLYHAVPHPQFSQNHFLFVSYVYPGPEKHARVSRFELTAGDPPRLKPGSERVIITWPTGGHSGGCLQFGKDGMLYVSTGDGSGPNPPDGLTTGQNIGDLLGSILRIDVDQPSGDSGYSIPADNPFVDRPNTRPEIWSYGLRNPWKFGIDPQTGQIFAADNGWETWEMIHEIVRGGNCGWPIMEGRAILRSEVPRGPTPIRPPVKDHPHTEANSVIGGPVYRGQKLPALDGSFIYGDYITGTIWSINGDDHQTLVDTDMRIVAFSQGNQGELYALDHDFTGQIYEILPTDRKDTSADFPRRLSETGLFQSLEDLTPAAGVVPYRVKVNRWLDGATAQRFVAIPGQEKIQWDETPNAAASYPDGTVFVKHLSYPQTKGQPVRLETQILHYQFGQWHPYSYVWDEAGQDAELVDSIGTDRVVNLPAVHPHTSAGPRTWHVNAQNECKLCHDAAAGYVLGFRPNQLDVPLADDAAINQLEALAAMGVTTSAPSPNSFAASRLVDPRDETQPLDDRARSYLHANCSMCHHPGGNAIVSFYLRRELPFEKLNTNKSTGIGTFGMQDAKIIVPGDPYRSVLMYRMSKLGYARMPYIGSRVVDSFGVGLIEQWIRSMPAEAGRELSPPAQPQSAESIALKQLAGTGDANQRLAKLPNLLQTTEGSLALIANMHQGQFDQQAFAAAVSLGKKANADVRGLFETFVPEAERRATLGPNIQPQTVLEVAGDPGRGKLIFFSDSARCRNCHDLSDEQQSVGPTLLAIRKKYPRRPELLQQILQPSLKIEEAFSSWIVLTTSGRVYTGLLVKQDEKSITLKTAEKKTVTIPREEIEVTRKSETSLMPDRILSDLTAQEAADLLDYLLSLEVEGTNARTAE